MNQPEHILHVFSSFETGGPEIRTIGLINKFGPRFRHTIMATDGRYGARVRLDPGVSVAIVPPPPGKGGWLYGFSLRGVIRQVAPSILATYNWGAIDAVIAGRLLATIPIVHAEDGFGPEEAARLKRRRVLARRVLLRGIFATVVPSTTLLKAALDEYRIPRAKVRLIPNGVDVERFRPRDDPQWRRSHGVPDDAVLVGFVGALRPEKRLTHLLQAVRRAEQANVWVALVGDGPCRAELASAAQSLGIADRVIFAGNEADTAPAYASFDLFAMSSMTEQMPIALLEAMSSGLPALCTDVGDTAAILGDAEIAVAPPADDLDAYVQSLVRFVNDRLLRERVGARNRAKCQTEFSEERMLQQYAELYCAATTSQRQKTAAQW